MTYLRLENGSVVEYPIYEGDIRLRFAQTSFTTPFVPPANFHLVIDAPLPQISHLQNIKDNTPVFVNGEWVRQWIVTNATSLEIEDRTNNKAALVRSDRTRRLADCDWTQLPDAALDGVDVSAWTLYRQQLRDLPAHDGFPWDIDWPSMPAALPME